MFVCKFKVSPLDECPSFDILRERTDEEDIFANQELSRLKQSYSMSERQRILQLAHHAGESAAQVTFQKIAQKWEKGGIPLDEGAVKTATAELEKVVGTLQSDIVKMTGETFTALTDRIAAVEIKKIIAGDFHTKVYRQLYDLERLERFRCVQTLSHIFLLILSDAHMYSAYSFAIPGGF